MDEIRIQDVKDSDRVVYLAFDSSCDEISISDLAEGCYLAVGKVAANHEESDVVEAYYVEFASDDGLLELTEINPDDDDYIVMVEDGENLTIEDLMLDKLIDL